MKGKMKKDASVVVCVSRSVGGVTLRKGTEVSFEKIGESYRVQILSGVYEGGEFLTASELLPKLIETA